MDNQLLMNRYIKAMEIGLESEKDGISYFDLLKQLNQSLGYKFESYGSEASFISWFLQNFSDGGGKAQNKYIENNKIWYWKLNQGEEFAEEYKPHARAIKTYFEKKYWLDGQAAKQYLDYQELQESRKMAASAKKQSNISIIIATMALLASSGLGIYSIATTPKMPYHVNVVEDKNTSQKLDEVSNQLMEIQTQFKSQATDSTKTK